MICDIFDDDDFNDDDHDNDLSVLYITYKPPVALGAYWATFSVPKLAPLAAINI